jgi:hypothetical protein
VDLKTGVKAMVLKVKFQNRELPTDEEEEDDTAQFQGAHAFILADVVAVLISGG